MSHSSGAPPGRRPNTLNIWGAGAVAGPGVQPAACRTLEPAVVTGPELLGVEDAGTAVTGAARVYCVCACIWPSVVLASTV